MQPASSRQKMPELPDIILITVDTLRADRLGVYGYAEAQTPNIDALGQRGIVFANATVPLPRTTPGLASLLTGLSPDGHGSREVWEPVDVESGTRLAEVFREAGYATVGLSANSAAGRKQGLAAGFDDFLDQRQIKRSKRRDDADVVTSEALRLVDGIEEDAPLLLWVHYVESALEVRSAQEALERTTQSAKCRALQRRMKTGEVSLGQMFVDAEGIADRGLRRLQCAL